nr:hypothetical protein [Salmonella enterica]
MNVEISGKDLKAMMSHAADPKNGMLHVSKTAKFKHYNTKPLGRVLSNLISKVNRSQTRYSVPSR